MLVFVKLNEQLEKKTILALELSSLPPSLSVRLAQQELGFVGKQAFLLLSMEVLQKLFLVSLSVFSAFSLGRSIILLIRNLCQIITKSLSAQWIWRLSARYVGVYGRRALRVAEAKSCPGCPPDLKVKNGWGGDAKWIRRRCEGCSPKHLKGYLRCLPGCVASDGGKWKHSRAVKGSLRLLDMPLGVWGLPTVH